MQAAIDFTILSIRMGVLNWKRILITFSETLRSLGHEIHIGTKTSGLHGIRIGKGRLEGADKRRGGYSFG